MKKAINAWSADPTIDFETMFSQLAKAGFDGVELNLDKPGRSAHSIYLETPDEEILRIKALADQYGLQIVSVSSSWYGNSMGDPQQKEFYQSVILRQIRIAQLLDAGAILIVPGGVTPERNSAQTWQNCIDLLEEIKQEIQKSGILVGLEHTWNLCFTSPYDLSRMIDTLGTPTFGAYYDVGNVVPFAYSQHWIDALEKRIIRVHVKDYLKHGSLADGGRFVQLLEGSIDWPAVIAALRRIGFDGALTAEVSKSDPQQSYPDYYRQVADSIDKIIHM